MGRKILIVDDEKDVADLARFVLAGEGYEVATVFDGTAALASIRASPPDLVLLDIALPDIDGIEILRRLREDPPTTAMPVVMFSTRKEPGTIERARSLGAHGYVKKPFDPDDLAAQVKEALGR